MAVSNRRGGIYGVEVRGGADEEETDARNHGSEAVCCQGSLRKVLTLLTLQDSKSIRARLSV
jgi:hypothetical protein